MIGFEKQLVSKVLIFEDDPAASTQLKTFCNANGLIALKQTTHSSMHMLEHNIDLGAVLISENYKNPAEQISNGLDLACRIHGLRRELPDARGAAVEHPFANGGRVGRRDRLRDGSLFLSCLRRRIGFRRGLGRGGRLAGLGCNRSGSGLAKQS